MSGKVCVVFWRGCGCSGVMGRVVVMCVIVIVCCYDNAYNSRFCRYLWMIYLCSFPVVVDDLLSGISMAFRHTRLYNNQSKQ